jgi:LPS-assembly lipoprotein
VRAPRYRLDVRLDDKLEGLGLLADDTVGRERRTLRARYQLVDTSSGEICSMPPPVRRGHRCGLQRICHRRRRADRAENLTRVVADQIVTTLAIRLRKGDVGAARCRARQGQPRPRTPALSAR